MLLSLSTASLAFTAPAVPASAVSRATVSMAEMSKSLPKPPATSDNAAYSAKTCAGLVQSFGETAANLVEHEPDQRLGAADVRRRNDEIE